jgi:NOL1/NOP2/sun family putative RNA methylase
MTAARRRRSRRSVRERSIDLERYRSIMPDWSAFMAAAERPEPTVFRVRTGRIDEAELIARLKARGFQTRQLEGLPSFHQVEDGPGPVSLTPEHWLGLIYVQQASTGVAAPVVGPSPGERVLDMCAAPGGKTTHMAELMNDSGCLVASEISESRIRGLLGNVYRLGHPNILVVSGDARDFPEGPLFDRVLLDAPCSGEGTLRRRGGKPPNQSASFVGYVTRAQKELLEKAVRLTRPGGTILYVTCTFAPEENEAVVSDALARLPVDLEPISLPVPHAPGLTAFGEETYDARLEGAARIYPHHLDSGGLFVAKLRKLDDGASTLPPEEIRDHQWGWSPVPSVFPGDDSAHDEAERRLAAGLTEIAERQGVTRSLQDSEWCFRGGRAWMHSIEEWPLEVWAEGKWRPISIGIRAIDFDSRERPRASNDLLRWLDSDITRRVIDVSPGELEDLLNRAAVPSSVEERGPVALRYHGDVVGRGAVTVDGLKSEIPKARASDLLRIMKRETEG